MDWMGVAHVEVFQHDIYTVVLAENANGFDNETP
jgi:hypothetical protein